MDTSQPRRGLKAFLKHATVRISSTRHNGLAHDSASAYSIDDDGKSQRSSSSFKKDSKLRRIGRGIREWRLKRRRLRGDTRPEISFTLDGKSFTSSEASLYEASFEDEYPTDEDETVEWPGNHAQEPIERVRRGHPQGKLPCEIVHEEVAARQSPAVQLAPQAVQSRTQSRNKVSLQQRSVTILPPPIPRSFAWPHPTHHDKTPKVNGVVFRRDSKCAADSAQITLKSGPTSWTGASRLLVAPKSCDPEHHGEVAVAQGLDRRWMVQTACTNTATDIVRPDWAAQGAKSCTLGGDTLGKGAVYICSAGAASMRWIEKAIDLVIAVGNARAVQNDVSDVKGMIRLDLYFELRGLGAWVEFHWAPAHARLPGNDMADRMAPLSRWWPAKVAPRSEQGAALVIELKVPTFYEPWTGYCPHRGLPRYNEHNSLQLLEESEGRHVIISAKGPVGCITTPVGGARAVPGGLALQHASPAACRLLQHPSVFHMIEEREAKYVYSTPIIRIELPPRRSRAFEPSQQKGPIPQPPPPLPQPKPKARRKVQGKNTPATSGKLLCTHCWHKGHLIHQCFQKFPEQKVEFPQRYARYIGRRRLEKVMPGAFSNLARLHPHLTPQPFYGQDSRYMFGQVGILPHLTPRQCAAWAVRYQAAQPGPDQRRHLREEHGRVEALDPLLD